MKKKINIKYNEKKPILISNIKTITKNVKLIPLTHNDTTAHFPCLEQALQAIQMYILKLLLIFQLNGRNKKNIILDRIRLMKL